MNDLDNFTEQQAKFVTIFAATDNMSRACAGAGITRSTGYAWMAKPEYQQAVQQMRSQTIASAHTSLLAGLEDAVAAVRDVLTSENVTTNNRLRAAELVIAQAQILLEKQEILARLDRLEGTIGEK